MISNSIGNFVKQSKKPEQKNYANFSTYKIAKQKNRTKISISILNSLRKNKINKPLNYYN